MWSTPEPTWQITKGKIGDIRTADLQSDAVLRETELRFMVMEMVAFQEITARLVGIKDSQLSTSDSVFNFALILDNFAELVIASLA
jgi:hypothetical protein